MWTVRIKWTRRIVTHSAGRVCQFSMWRASGSFPLTAPSVSIAKTFGGCSRCCDCDIGKTHQDVGAQGLRFLLSRGERMQEGNLERVTTKEARMDTKQRTSREYRRLAIALVLATATITILNARVA